MQMHAFYELLNQYVDFFPLVALFGLFLAGLNLPVSEDLIIITGAIICHKKLSLMPLTLTALYIGVIATDFFQYWVGSMVRKGTGKTKFFRRMVPDKALHRMHHYLDKYGIFAFIAGRFVPFGLRNSIFFASGFFNLKFRSFVIYDLVAAMISINTLFFLVFSFGEVVEKPIKIAGIVLLIAIFSAIISLIVRFIISWRKDKANGSGNPST